VGTLSMGSVCGSHPSTGVRTPPIGSIQQNRRPLFHFAGWQHDHAAQLIAE
jgi:hypothetical protein